jgi:hypothetical protein
VLFLCDETVKSAKEYLGLAAGSQPSKEYLEFHGALGKFFHGRKFK